MRRRRLKGRGRRVKHGGKVVLGWVYRQHPLASVDTSRLPIRRARPKGRKRVKDDPLLAELGTSRNGHSIFAPSASASWMNCSGSLLAHARSRDTAGFEAAEGTVAHAVAERWAKRGERPDYLIGNTEEAEAGGNVYAIKIDATMLHHVGRFVEWCAEVPGDHYFEQRVDLSSLTPIPGQGGTADHFACQRGHLYVTDLKYGTGVRVYVEGNTQVLLYAAGVFMEWDWIYGFNKVTLRVCQPRLDVFEEWTITRQELLDFMASVKVRAKAAWREKAPRTPSPKACQWCPDNPRCVALVKLADDVIDNTFDMEDDSAEPVPKTYPAALLSASTSALAELGSHAKDRFARREPSQMSTRALAYAYGYRKMLENWFKRIGDVLLDRAERGEEVPFFTLSEGRRNRRYKDATLATQTILERFDTLTEDAIAPRKLLSVNKLAAALRAEYGLKPGQLEEVLTPLINVVRSKRSLVPVGERPDEEDLTDDFDEEDD